MERIMTKIIFMPAYKNWFKGLGLHHASVVAALTLACHFIGIGSLGAAFGMGWYASREWGLDIYPPRTFEIMDFVSPAIVSITYLVAFGGSFFG